MTLYFATTVSICSMILPLTAVLVRRKRMTEDYLPMMLLVLIGVVSEIADWIMDVYVGHSSIIGNLYVVAELLLILRLYKRMNVTFSDKLLIVFGISGVMVWLLDNFILHSLHTNNSIFRMVESLMIVFIAIDKLHHLLLYNGKPQVRDPEFVITIGFLLYFVYKSFVEAFHLFPVPHQRSFYRTLWMILNLVNIITNIILSLGILCIRPKPQHFMAS
jgi:hypothetical protein